MAKMVYDEWYGEMTYAERHFVRKYNVSPADHDALKAVYGDDHEAITKAIKTYVYPTGSNQFSVFEFWNRRPL